MFVAAQFKEFWQMERSQSSKKYQGKPGMCWQAAMTSAYRPCQPPSVRSTVPDHCSAKGHHSLPVKSLHKVIKSKSGWLGAVNLFIRTKYSAFQIDSLLLALLWHSLQFCLFSSELFKTMRAHVLTIPTILWFVTSCFLLAFSLTTVSPGCFWYYIISKFLRK